MKFLVFLPLFAALLVTSCGEKSSPEGSESASEKPSGIPNSLSDSDVDRLLKEAIAFESLEERDGLLYQNSEPYSGWVKEMHDPGQVKLLRQLKSGKPHGRHALWHENGQKRSEGTFKDGKLNGTTTVWHKNGQKMREGFAKNGMPDGLQTFWHENGQKQAEATIRDGKIFSAKYWNSKGEEVETEEESLK